MNIALDAADKKILELIQQDATLTHQEIADRAGLSSTSVWRRIRNLEEVGTQPTPLRSAFSWTSTGLELPRLRLGAERVPLVRTVLILCRASATSGKNAQSMRRTAAVLQLP